MVGVWVALGVICGTITSASQLYPPLGPHKSAHLLADRPLEEDPGLVQRCKERYRNATLDHYNWAPPPEGMSTYRQRYFVCDEYYERTTKDGSPGPILFYVGNEADVTLYLNATGLIWESAPALGALIVFAEHRYYGKSLPFGRTQRKHLAWLTSEQALADYAELIVELKEEMDTKDSAVIGFGGSYGGMLATWFRLKYPHILDGAIAGSAPIWTYYGEDPPVDPGTYAKIVTRDATPAAGAAAACAPNIRSAWDALFEAGKSTDGRAAIREAFRLCPSEKLEGPADVDALAEWLYSAFDFMAMGNYPYPSSYILNGAGKLPPFPMRAACEHMADPDLKGKALLEGLGSAVGVFYNYSNALPCFNYTAGPNKETEEDGNLWGFQYCSEHFMPMSRDGVNDMFWPQPFDKKAAMDACERQYGIRPRPLWPTITWGGKKLDALTNVVFSNGGYDPWSGLGVLTNLSDSVVSLIIPEGAFDSGTCISLQSTSLKWLMFSNKDDPKSVKIVREAQRVHMRRWIKEAAERNAKRHGRGTGSLSLARP